MDVTKNDIDIYLSEVKESIRNNRYRIEQNPGIQSFLGSLLFRVFRSGSSVGSFSRVWF